MQIDPNELPHRQEVQKRSQALAMLDAIVCPEWESRYFSFNATWSSKEQMGSMRNGQGDEWFLLVGPFGAAIKGLDHESKAATDDTFASAIRREVPVQFNSFLDEPAFNMYWASFCFWSASDEASWHKVAHASAELSTADDGSELLALLVEPPPAYAEFARWYYEVDLALEAIESIYAHIPLTRQLVLSINPDVPFADASSFAAEIGYPVASSE